MLPDGLRGAGRGRSSVACWTGCWREPAAGTSPGSTRRWRCRCSRDSRPRAIVYDCMDELSAFTRRAARSCASARRAAEARRSGVHRRAAACTRPSAAAIRTCSACRAASMPSTSAAARERGQPRPGRPGAAHPASAPRLFRRHRRADGPRPGRRLADARPGWQVVMVGPVVKIDPAACRGGPTSTSSGSSVRASCRSYLAGWDVACCRSPSTNRPLHQPDQDARVHRRREAGRLDADPRRGARLGPEGGWRPRPGRDRCRSGGLRRGAAGGAGPAARDLG